MLNKFKLFIFAWVYTTIFDTSKEGLETLFYPWQVKVIEEFLRRRDDDGVEPETSASVHKHLLGTEYEASRASVINFLEYLVEEEILERDEESCKGGSRGLYTLRLSRHGFEELIVRRILNKLSKVFPAFRPSLTL